MANSTMSKQVKILTCVALLEVAVIAQTQIPEWCRPLPRPEYKSLHRVNVSDPWFEVYEVRPGVFALYEPHQAEEIISYLIVGEKQSLLFDTGMGISDIRKVTSELTRLPIVVLNSHTHNDHVGGNWQFETIYGMDTDFTRTNARGSREDAQAEIVSDQICGNLPKEFNPKTYVTRRWKIKEYVRDGARIDLGGRQPAQALRIGPDRFSPRKLCGLIRTAFSPLMLSLACPEPVEGEYEPLPCLSKALRHLHQIIQALQA